MDKRDERIGMVERSFDFYCSTKSDGSKTINKLSMTVRKLLDLKFNDFLIQYNDIDDYWVVDMWFDFNAVLSIIVSEEDDYMFSIYHDNELIISDWIEDIDLMIIKWKNIEAKSEERKRIKEENSFWHGFCNIFHKIKEKIWK